MPNTSHSLASVASVDESNCLASLEPVSALSSLCSAWKKLMISYDITGMAMSSILCVHVTITFPCMTTLKEEHQLQP